MEWRSWERGGLGCRGGGVRRGQPGDHPQRARSACIEHWGQCLAGDGKYSLPEHLPPVNQSPIRSWVELRIGASENAMEPMILKKGEGYRNCSAEIDPNCSPGLGCYLDTTKVNCVSVVSDLTISLTVLSDSGDNLELEPPNKVERTEEPPVIQQVAAVQ